MTSTSAATAPGPRNRFPGQTLLKLARQRLELLRATAAAYGDISQLRLGGQRVVILTHPDDIRDVLVTHQRSFQKGQGLERAKVLVGDGLLTSEGDFHLRQRRLVQPAFHRSRIAAYGAQMTSAAMTEQAQWIDGETRDMQKAMMHITLNIVASTLFGADVAREGQDIGAAVEAVFKSFRIGFGPFTALLDALPSARKRQFTAGKSRLDATINRIIAERRTAQHDTGDLLSMLLAATDTEGDGTGMTDQQLRNEVMTLFIAGHETTANALTWTWLMLARNPAAEAALHAEIDAVLGDRPPTMDDMAQLPYTRAVVAESMRLYPPAYILGRRATGPYTVRNYDFPARTIFVAPQFIVHRDPRWWPNANQFSPERWLDAQATEQRPKMAYFPFGAGTRICVGEQFAWMEAMLVLATIARHWRVRVDGPDPVAEPIIVLRPKGGLAGRVERR
jgi:cytochrome P450